MLTLSPSGGNLHSRTDTETCSFGGLAMCFCAQSIALFSLLVTLSCGILGGGEKYEDATLADAMSGAVRSGSNAYRLASPTIAVIQGDYALLREGRTVQILAADDFDEIGPGLEGKDFYLCVKKWASPYPHLRLQQIEMDGEKSETQWVLAESELPMLVDHQLYDTSTFQKIDVSGWEGDVPRELVDEKIWLSVKVRSVQVEREEVEVTGETAGEPADEMVNEITEIDEELAAELAEESDTMLAILGETEEEESGLVDIFYITVGGAEFEMLPLQEDGVMLLLKGQEAENRSFGLGGYITELYPRREAEQTGVTGRFQMHIFDFGGKYVLLR